MIYGYIRVSTDKQTVENQRLEIETWAKKRGFEIEEWIEETISGTKSYVKGKFRELVMKTLKKGDTLIISELSRMSRNLMEIMEVLKYLMETEVQVQTVKEGYELGNNITAKVLAFAFGLSAEIERTLISERTKAGLRKRKEDGIILGRPYGAAGWTKLDDKLEDIKELLNKGVSYCAIGRIYNVHRVTVSNFAIRHNLREIAPKARLRAVTQEKKYEIYHKEITEYVYLGLNYAAIAQQLNEKQGADCDSNAIRQYLGRWINKSLYNEYCEIQKDIRAKSNAGVNNARTA